MPIKFAVLQTEVHDGPLPEGDALTQYVLKVAAHIFRERRRLEQFFILLATQPTRALLTLVAEDDAAAYDPDREWVDRAVREAAAKVAGRAIYTVSEIWIGTMPAGVKRVPDGYRARNDSNRKECAMVMVENPLARPPMQMWRAEIERSKGRPHLLEWKQFANKDGSALNIEGRLSYLLPREAYGTIGEA